MLIDFHTHAFPDALAHRAMDKLASAASLTPVTDGTGADLVAKMDDWKVDKAFVLNIATSPKNQKNVNRFAAEIKNTGGGRLIPAGSVHPLAEDFCSELEFLQENGINLIKLHPEYQEFCPDDKIAYPIYDECASRNITVVFHAGWDFAYMDRVRASAASLMRVAADFPSTRFVFAHLGAFLLWDDVEELLCELPNVYFDTSFLSGYIDPVQYKKIIMKRRPDHVLFGSDCPWMSSAESLRLLETMHLSAAEMDMITFQNAQRLFLEV